MLSRRKSLAAVTAVTAALAVAAPTASADNAPAPIVDPTVCQLLDIAGGQYTQGYGGGSLADVLKQAGASVRCSAPAGGQSPQFVPQLVPFVPWLH